MTRQGSSAQRGETSAFARPFRAATFHGFSQCAAFTPKHRRAQRSGASQQRTQPMRMQTCAPVRCKSRLTHHLSCNLLPRPRVPVRKAKLNGTLRPAWLVSRILIEQLPSVPGASDSFLNVVVPMVLDLSGAGLLRPASACGLYLQHCLRFLSSDDAAQHRSLPPARIEAVLELTRLCEQYGKRSTNHQICG
ncbi:hypothetical protein BST61_g7468 [Cercospora zeina]